MVRCPKCREHPVCEFSERRDEFFCPYCSWKLKMSVPKHQKRLDGYKRG